jgi:hypothetical protein
MANANLKESFSSGHTVSFKVADAINIGKYFEPGSFDFILSDRCLINLETSNNQYEAIKANKLP